MMAHLFSVTPVTPRVFAGVTENSPEKRQKTANLNAGHTGHTGHTAFYRPRTGLALFSPDSRRSEGLPSAENSADNSAGHLLRTTGLNRTRIHSGGGHHG